MWTRPFSQLIFFIIFNHYIFLYFFSNEVLNMNYDNYILKYTWLKNLLIKQKRGQNVSGNLIVANLHDISIRNRDT